MKDYNMRNWIKSAYPNSDWGHKVDAMPDSQVVALYYRFVRQGKIKGA